MIDIRLASINDIRAIINFRIELLKELGNLKCDSDIEIFEREIKIYVERKLHNGFISWIAEENGILVGTGGLNIYERPPIGGNISGLEGCITNMYTVPEHRGKGVATALLKEMIEYLKIKGVGKVRLHHSKDSRPIYEKCGFILKQNEMELNL